MSDVKHDLRSIWAFLDNVAFTQGYVDAGGIKTRYVNSGPKDAPIVVMVHGMGGTWENFIGNFAEVSKHFNTYAYDLVGHGYSDKPDRIHDVAGHVAQLEGFIKALDLKKVNLLGLSIGGWISTKFTIKHPELVDKLIVMSAWGRPREIETPEGAKRMQAVLEQRMESVRNPTFEGIDTVFETLIKDPADRMRDLLTLRLRVYSLDGMENTMMNVFMGLRPDVWDKNMLTDEDLESVSRPTLVIACTDNEDVFLKMAYEYKDLIPGVEWCEVLGASHWPQWEKADDVNEAVINFFKA